MRSVLVLALALGCGLGPVGGIHARMGYSEESGLRVIDVPEGPAQDAGLRVGDYILAIDGESNWLEGALLVIVYIILAVSFFEFV